MDFHGDVGWGQAGDVGDGGGIELFEVAKDDLAVDRLQLEDELLEFVERSVGAGFRGGQCLFQLFEADQAGGPAAFAQDIGGGGIVGDAEGPGFERAAAIEGGEATPELEVDLLAEVAAFVGIGFVTGGEAVDQAAVVVNGLVVALLLFDRVGLGVTLHVPIVDWSGRFLTGGVVGK